MTQLVQDRLRHYNVAEEPGKKIHRVDQEEVAKGARRRNASVYQRERKPEHVSAAIRYVVDEQADTMAVFEAAEG
jgi:hypothetical protein